MQPAPNPRTISGRVRQPVKRPDGNQLAVLACARLKNAVVHRAHLPYGNELKTSEGDSTPPSGESASISVSASSETLPRRQQHPRQHLSQAYNKKDIHHFKLQERLNPCCVWTVAATESVVKNAKFFLFAAATKNFHAATPLLRNS